ncbi:MAG: formylglycine-generating enzyme family protein [Brasilonema angustatum HA4187-MV1]|jgi:formylglycine-generating enzyme required for sulfatase activity|nr:formylglycine-generating enzyme family protein [Brasilonema angustatum HA4187-MV1]
MGLSGETIRKIREALKSAFPNRDELVMMLRMELDISESEVPNHSNYNLVVFHLIQQLDSQNRIPELIKGALNERRGNPDLQQVAQEINAIYSNSNKSLLKWFEFDVVTVNAQGWKIARKRCRAQYFTEDLGNGVTLEMVEIPGGTFMMGAPKNEQGSKDNERPQHQVTVQPFFMGRYPVTQAQWRAVAALPQVNKELDPNPSYFKGDNRPVERISWYDALEFCARLNFRINFTAGRDYRLPSEAEWEYACRAGTMTPFYFGETITTDLANYDGNYTYGNAPKGEYRQETTTVGSFPPNAFGLYDMHGNVLEWCADTWHPNYEGALKDGSEWIAENNNNHLLRGGSWHYVPDRCRSASRLNDDEGVGNIFGYDGFRVACSAAWT